MNENESGLFDSALSYVDTQCSFAIKLTLPPTRRIIDDVVSNPSVLLVIPDNVVMEAFLPMKRHFDLPVGV
ncbi:hypothetical protein [Parabacteroides sp. FAFU027]|uniref:hypothetical protein n=1 Tax=Parabacteroides sp. FAFU027 TaxID=2922715 RepID=UPI001FAF90FA|nr:hypothetical protein [Parabacteroides sp. FAFU027]